MYIHVEYASSKSLSDIVKQLKGRISRKLQEKYPELPKRYWGRHFWAIGCGVWSTGNITGEKMMKQYLEHHRNPDNVDADNIILK